jgi:putative nucleotidyltransferase with HDIG domain
MDALDVSPPPPEAPLFLPVLPSVLARVMALDNRDDLDPFEALVRLAESDPCFAVRVLQLASTPWFARGTPPRSVTVAIGLLGTAATSDLVLGTGVQEVFVPRSTPHRMLWLHAVQTAEAARALATRWPEPVDPDEAHLAGLIHDIGRFQMFHEHAEDLARVDEQGWTSPCELVEAELEALGIDHAELGARQMRQWQLAEPLVRLVASHHASDPRQVDEDLRPLFGVVQLADRVSVAMQTLKPGQDWTERVARAGRSSPLFTDDLIALVPGIEHEADRRCRELGLS